MPKLDFAEVRMFAIGEVLKHYSVSIKGRPPQLMADCPLPTHTTKTGRFSFKWNTEKNVWCCMSESCSAAYSDLLGGRNGGDVIDLVVLLDDCSPLQAAKKIMEWSGTSQHITKAPTPEPQEVNPPLKFTLQGVKYCDYLKKRGISEETATRFGVGFYSGKGSMAGRVVVPIQNEKGELVAYAGRALDDAEPKYKLPAGFHKSAVLYNLHRAEGKTLIVVEGFFGAMWLTQCGYPNVVALMGHTASEEQLSLLDGHRVILMLDNAEGGESERLKTLERIASQCFTRSVMIPTQPDECSKEELDELLSHLI